MVLEISGIQIKVERKKIKNMHLYVKPPHGQVSVSAPLAMSNEAIERFVRTKTAWIKKQVEKFGNQPRQGEREYVTGETLYVWGKPYYLQLEHGQKNQLLLKADKAILTVRKESTTLQRERFVREWYRSELKKEVDRILPKWESVTSLKASGWQSKYMVTRWGSCNIKTGKIWLNVQLAKKTPECLEYVIVHELVHLVEKKHNERFTSLMTRYLPRWKEIRKTLNSQTLDFKASLMK